MKKLFLPLLFSMQTFAADYTFIAIDDLSEQKLGVFVLTDIYKQLGIDIEVEYLPGKRAEYETNRGRRDGEIMRIYSYGDKSPNTIRVPTPYYQVHTTAFYKKNKNININDISQLNNYVIAKIRGVKHTENMTINHPKVSNTSNNEELMKLVLQDLADIALTSHFSGHFTLKKMGIDSITYNKPYLASQNIYHYIHQDHEELVPLINKQLIKMKENGELEQLIAQGKLQLEMNYLKKLN